MVNQNLTENSAQDQGDIFASSDGFAAEGDLPPPWQLALAYAPASARDQWRALLILDRRLARIVAQASEPMLAQIRLAWWREMFGRPVADWPVGEPLLARLTAWGEECSSLAALADGWEAMVGDAPLPATAFAALSDGRARAMAGLAHVTGSGTARPVVQSHAYRWSLADIAIHLADEQERARVMALLKAADRAEGSMDKAMRPLNVLRVMAERAASAARPIGGAGDFLAAIRAGLTGR
ncbi:hypothetical protein [Croceicoccus sp. Ery5]|uniref:hypothetical protein n=1 Tax=Croceicoccus sp. Ery5 TaxID=1703340 RepID=UPI001E2F54C4|nr:hypothetical protein [Croceicoccus sp. Ery5]